MKQVFLIRQGGALWDVIVRRLERVNAGVVVLEAHSAIVALSRLQPDLVILGEEDYCIILESARHLNKLVICDQTPPGRILRGREGRKTVKLGWPTGEKAFLDLTRQLLRVPERRVHRTTVQVCSKNGKARCISGETMDFSTTGMAFVIDGRLGKKSEVFVLFDELDGKKTLRLNVELVRSTPVGRGKRTLYGGRFVHLAPAERHALERFVWLLR